MPDLILDIESRVHEVDILLIQFFTQQLHGFAEALEVNDLPFPQEFNDIINVRIIGQTQDIVIGDAGLLLCCKFV